MASTNKTTNYDLSQYIGTDKPTYLVDYNQDMAKIDAGITGAKSVADANAVNIGDIEELTTTAKSDLVSAVNEVDSDLSSVSSQVGDNTSDIGTLQGNVGNLTNLSTTAKNNLVSAINEVNEKADDNTSDIGNLNTLTTSNKSNLVGAINETRHSFDVEVKKEYLTTNSITPVNATVTGVNVKIAKSTNGDIGKIYGNITFTANFTASSFTLPNSGIRTDSSYGIDNIVMLSDSAGTVRQIKPLTVNDNELYMVFTGLTNGQPYTVSIIPVMLYFKDFGDTPAQ